MKGIKEQARHFASETVYFLKNTFLLLRQNFKEVMVFIIACSVISLIATAALTSITTDLLMRFAGTTYISPANLREVLLNPPAVIVLIAEQVLATLIALFQIAGLLHAFSMGQIGLDTNLASMVAAGLRTCRKALSPRNWLIVPFLLVLLPLAKVMALSSTSYKLIVPGFINQTIDYTALYSVLYSILYVCILGVLLVYIFSINIFVLRDDSFLQGCAQSRKLGKGRYLNTVMMLGILTLLVHFAINTVASAVTVNIAELMDLAGKSAGVVTKSVEVGTATYALRQILQGLLIPAINNAGLAVLFYRYIDDESLLGTLSPNTFRTASVSRPVKIAAIVATVALVAGTGFFLANRYAFLAQPVDRPLVCAHRGDNANAPENTMPAFELAFSENLKWIELDVHQTADNILVCSHDESIKRVTGHDLLIREHTYEELSRYEMGDWMPGAYEHVVIPKLEDVLLRAKENGVNVQVELKGSPQDEDFEEHVLEVSNKCGMHDNVMVIGQDAQRMIRVAELDPTITKGYCMFVAQGNVEDIPYTDHVSIEETNVTPELVERLHEKGVMVFCWTVDLQDTVQYLVSCDVDVIGTDDPILVSAALDHADYSGGLPRFFHIVMNLVASMAR